MERTLNYRDHRRELGDNRYVYPVVSRRAAGLSIGVNLNPDKVCNFDCPYCQVDRRVPGDEARIDLDRLKSELDDVLDRVTQGDLWSKAPFSTVAPELRRVADIALAGDGEPTSPPEFPAAADLLRRCRDGAGLTVPIRLLTNSTLLHRARVKLGLPFVDELWCKLDAGTESWFSKVDGTSFPFERVLANLRETVARRPIVVQSMFCALGDEAPDDAEIAAWAGRLAELATIGTVQEVQVYTVARPPADSSVRALPRARLDAIAAVASARGLKVEVWGGV